MESAPGIDEEGWISIITDITAGKEAGPISVEVRKSDYHAYKQSSSATLLPTFTYSPTLVLPEELQLLVEEHLKDAACDCSPGQNCLSDPECSCVNTYGRRGFLFLTWCAYARICRLFLRSGSAAHAKDSA